MKLRFARAGDGSCEFAPLEKRRQRGLAAHNAASRKWKKAARFGAA
jgi:hypothetical protein